MQENSAGWMNDENFVSFKLRVSETGASYFFVFAMKFLLLVPFLFLLSCRSSVQVSRSGGGSGGGGWPGFARRTRGVPECFQARTGEVRAEDATEMHFGDLILWP